VSASPFTARVPEPYRILGLKLKPLSLGRYCLLRRFDCAFVSEEPDAIARPADLVLGVFICAQSCREFLELLSNGKFQIEIQRWGHKLFETGPWAKHLPKKLRRPKPFNYVEKVALFKSYLSDSVKIPKYWEEHEGDANSSGAHWTDCMEGVLRGELNWTEGEVNERPLSKAIGDYYKWMESKGAIHLVSDDEDAEMAKMAAANEAAFAALTRN
jgi:hypothetical protein